MDMMAGIQAAIDFPDEVADYDAVAFAQTLSEQIAKVDELLAGEEEGRILREGYRVALIGDPNVGKSSLLNALVRDDRAIVTEIAGTTRDVIEGEIAINGLPVVMLDTAGIRDSKDTVERLGIERSLKAMEEADLVLKLEDLSKQVALVGATTKVGDDSLVKARKVIRVGTKLDLASNQSDYDICVSAVEGTNINELRELMFSHIVSGSGAQIKINQRQQSSCARQSLPCKFLSSCSS